MKLLFTLIPIALKILLRLGWMSVLRVIVGFALILMVVRRAEGEGRWGEAAGYSCVSWVVGLGLEGRRWLR